MKSPDEMTREELIAYADSVGAEYKPNWGRKRIVLAIAEARQRGEQRTSLIQRATRFGIHVPDDWDMGQLAELLDSIQDAGDAPSLPSADWPGASPRG